MTDKEKIDAAIEQFKKNHRVDTHKGHKGSYPSVIGESITGKITPRGVLIEYRVWKADLEIESGGMLY